jgi:hypothetical protein
MLQRKSLERFSIEFPPSLVHSQSKNYAERRAAEETLQQAQLQEALNIMVDLVKAEKGS